MKHELKITFIILLMFVITQFITLYVVNFYSPVKVLGNVQQNVTSPNQLPFGLEPPTASSQANFWETLLYILPSFVIAVVLFFVLIRLKAEIVMKAWFSLVIVVALSVSLISLMRGWKYAWIAALAVSVILTFFKLYKRNLIVHNVTELFIYPGIAAVFVAILSTPGNPNRGIYSMIALLAIISLYDMWAVWRSGVMQKMAKFQINHLKMLAGFFIPLAMKKSQSGIKLSKTPSRKKSRKTGVAILGGGDAAFPAIAVGVVLRRFGFTTVAGLQVPLASILIIIGATIGLGSILLLSKRDKFYPAMPFITAGVFAALGVCYLIF